MEYRFQISDPKLRKYFQNYNKELYNYFTCIKNNKSKRSGYESPYLFIAKKDEFQHVSFVKDFFSNLHNEWKKGIDVKKITRTESLFTDKINTHIDQMCHTYFGVQVDATDVADEEEW